MSVEMRNVSGVIVKRDAATVPASGAGQDPIFTVSGGQILLTGLIGEVTTVIGGTTPSLGITFNPTATGASTNICADTAITDDPVGTLWSITGTVADSIQTGLLLVNGLLQDPLVLSEGDIEIDTTAADTTGAAQWTLLYVPIDPGSAVAAAA